MTFLLTSIIPKPAYHSRWYSNMILEYVDVHSTEGTRQAPSASGIVHLLFPTLSFDRSVHQAGFLAQKRLARGLQLNINEATALIASQLQERIRDGRHTVPELMQHGKTILGRRHVLPSVPARLSEIQVEGTFHDG